MQNIFTRTSLIKLTLCMNRIGIRLAILLCLQLLFFSETALCQPASEHTSSVRERTNPNIIEPDFSNKTAKIPTILPYRNIKRPRIALVLSGGGARGAAAIGVLKVLEKNHIPIDFIIGTSIGSIVGGLYAGGYTTDQLEKVVTSTRWDEVINFSDDARRRDMFIDQKTARDRSLLTLRFEGFEPVIPSALSSGQRVTNMLNLLNLQSIYHITTSFDDLNIPLRIATTDLVTGKRFIIDHGDLTRAMRAAVTVPLLYTPVAIDSMQLLDGGLVANIPVDLAREYGADIVIVVDVTSPLRPPNKLTAPWEYADQIMGIFMQIPNNLQLKNADIVIRPELGNHLSSDFSGFDTLIARGEAAAEKLTGNINELYHGVKELQTVFPPENEREYKNPRFLFADTLNAERWHALITRTVTKSTITVRELKNVLGEIYGLGNFHTVSLLIEERPDSTLLQFTLIPNPSLNGIVLQGNSIISSEEIVSLFTPLFGKPLNHHRDLETMESILRLYRSRSYSLARIVCVGFDTSTGIASIVIDEGRIGNIVITGTQKTKDYIIWRELPFSQGEIFELSKASRAISNLYGTGLFDHVSIGYRLTGETQSVVIEAKERSSELLRFAVRVDDERFTQASIDIRNDNAFGIGFDTGIRFLGGLRNLNFTADLNTTRIFDTYLTFNLKGYVTRTDVNVYETDSTSTIFHWSRLRTGEYRQLEYGTSVSFGAQLERFGNVTGEARLEHHELTNIFNHPIQDQTYTISELRIGTKIDYQDRYPFPNSGVLLEGYVESPLILITDAVGYSKVFLRFDSYHTVYSRYTVHPKVIVGAADKTLPLSEQFALGGQQSFFGLNEYDARGRQIFVSSMEIRTLLPFKIFFDTYISVRYDLGSIWPEPEKIKLRDLHHAVGLILSLDTPIGPAEFSIGRSFYVRGDLFDRPISLGPFRMYFSIGYPLE